jgi:acetolactate synthase regulatory subunit
MFTQQDSPKVKANIDLISVQLSKSLSFTDKLVLLSELKVKTIERGFKIKSMTLTDKSNDSTLRLKLVLKTPNPRNKPGVAKKYHNISFEHKLIDWHW